MKTYKFYVKPVTLQKHLNMAKKRGYTWYPENWTSSKRVFRLNLEDRGLYRELIDLAYETDNKIMYEPDLWARLFGSTEKKVESIVKKLEKIVNADGEPLIIFKDNILFIPSCEPRLNLIRGGKKGGEKSKPNQKPIEKPLKNPSIEPDSNQKEIENKKESKIENEEEISNNDGFELVEDLLKKYLANKKLVDAVLSIPKKNKLENRAELESRLKEFNAELKSKSIFQKSWSDYTEHFLNWHRKTKNNKSEQPEKSSDYSGNR